MNTKINLPQLMKAMVLEKQRTELVLKEIPVPDYKNKILVKVIACGICRTDLHVIDGDLKFPKLPLIPGHEIIGEVVKENEDSHLKAGQLVGIPWLGYTCGKCIYCLRGMENLCENALFTGYTLDGGYAQYVTAFEQFCFPLPENFSDSSMAPLLCAGLIGYRSYAMTGSDVKNIGIYGFGAAAHIVIQVALHHGKNIYAFTKDGDENSQAFAKHLGAVWSGGSSQTPPLKLDAAIIYAPVGELIPKALKDIDKGRTVVCGGIHMSDIPSFPYKILWEERNVKSVANLTRRDAVEFLKIAEEIGIRTETEVFRLEEANKAIALLRKGKIKGAAVLEMN